MGADTRITIYILSFFDSLGLLSEKSMVLLNTVALTFRDRPDTLKE
jgi:hypothetical protein